MSASLTMLKLQTVWIIKPGKISQRDGNTRPLYLSPMKPVFRTRTNCWNQSWNNRLVQNWEKEYVKAVYCHPAYLREYIM